jgi:sec-independent protein translocase protein TatC
MSKGAAGRIAAGGLAGAGARPGAADDLPRMTLIEHLEELRRRLLRALIGLVLAFSLCFTFAEPIFRFLAVPVYRFLPPGTKLAFLGVTDPFLLYMKVSLLAAAFLAAPYLLWQAWGFIAPGLYQRERRHAAPFVIFGTLFFVAGGAFAYYVAFPFAVQFLLEVGAEFQAVITVERYFGFLLTVILGLGLMFELPIVIVLLAKVGLVTPGFLMKHFRWAVLIIVLVAALVTPTADVFNLLLFAGPALLLYLLGVAAAWVVTRDRRRAQLAEAAAAE